MQASTLPDASLASVLTLRGFGVAFGDRVVLAHVDAELPARGVCVLMGPAGGGKSTLLRTLAGVNHGQLDLRQWGSVHYAGEPLRPDRRPALAQQDMRYFTSTVRENLVSAFPDRGQLDRAAQRHRLDELTARYGGEELLGQLDEEALSLSAPARRLLSVLRAVGTDAPLVCIDEPTASLDAAQAAPILEAVRRYAREHAVLLITHHQGHARAVADQVILLAGGRVQEQIAAPEFFAQTSSPIVRHFLDTGGIALPRPDAAPETLSEDCPKPPELPAAATAPQAYVGPREFRWLLPGRLGGMPRPGIVATIEEDLAGLRRLGVDVLGTIEETATVDPKALREGGIEPLHFPLEDMTAPTEDVCANWCAELNVRIESGKVIALHCRAGQGRTGTLLACYLIFLGASAVEALDRVRGINPKWVSSDEQVRFLARFQAHCARLRAAPRLDQPLTSLV